MRYLTQGGESKPRFQLLLQLTKISSENLQDAMQDYLCKGYSDAAAAALNGVQLSNFTRALNKLNDVAAIVEQIKDLDWQHLKSVK